MQFLTYTLFMVATAQAHYRFPRIVVNGVAEARDWTTVRETKNYQDNHGVTDESSADMRCFQMAGGAQQSATIPAGGTLGFVAAASISHFGPVQLYMAKVPAGKDVNTWDASGNVWFKAGSYGASFAGGKADWPVYQKSQVTFTLPKNLPSGDYLARVESIALHQAQSPGGAQFYLSCAQIKVTDGGSGTPGPLVAIPGLYRRGEPGLMWSYSTPQTSYTPPGPAVWTG